MPEGIASKGGSDVLRELTGQELRRVIVVESDEPDLSRQAFPCGICGLRCMANRNALLLLARTVPPLRQLYLRRLPCLTDERYACSGVQVALQSVAAGLPMSPRPCQDSPQPEPES